MDERGNETVFERPHINVTQLHDEDGNSLLVPDYSVRLSPTIVPTETPTDTSIPCSDWRGCLLSCAVLLVLGTYGFICGLAGYRFNNCNNGHNNSLLH